MPSTVSAMIKGSDINVEYLDRDGVSEEDMKQRFERSQKILDLRKKYYDIYSTFLTQKQISRVYEIERDMMRRLAPQDGKRHRPEKPARRGGRIYEK